MTLDLTEDEAPALSRLFRDAIEYARYPFAPRLDPLKAILAKLEPPDTEARAAATAETRNGAEPWAREKTEVVIS